MLVATLHYSQIIQTSKMYVKKVLQLSYFRQVSPREDCQLAFLFGKLGDTVDGMGVSVDSILGGIFLPLYIRIEFDFALQEFSTAPFDEVVLEQIVSCCREEQSSCDKQTSHRPHSARSSTALNSRKTIKNQMIESKLRTVSTFTE